MYYTAFTNPNSHYATQTFLHNTIHLYNMHTHAYKHSYIYIYITKIIKFKKKYLSE